jgi:ribonuclease P protein component
LIRSPQSAIRNGVEVKRRYRLADKERFRLVRQTGISHAHPLLVLCLLPNDLSFSRCGFTVSRRLGKAVERNRARRRMQEAVRLAWDLIEPGWDIVWVARPAIGSAEFSEIQDACIRLLRRARVLRSVAVVKPEAASPTAIAPGEPAIRDGSGSEQ